MTSDVSDVRDDIGKIYLNSNKNIINTFQNELKTVGHVNNFYDLVLKEGFISWVTDAND